MDWTGYPVALDPAAPVDSRDALAAFLTADATFTRPLLDAIAAAQATPTELDKLTAIYPREVIAYGTWSATNPTPTGAELVTALEATPDPVVPDPAVELTPVTLDRAMLVRLTGDTSASVQLRYRTAPEQEWRTWQRTVPTPSVEVDGRLLAGTEVDARVTLTVTVDPAPPVYRMGA